MKRPVAIAVVVALTSAAIAAAPVHALTLEQYGVTLTGSGLIDHTTGLRWLDSGLTDGGLDDLQDWLDAGWRIATEEEVFYLMTRQASLVDSPVGVPLGEANFSTIMDRLTIDHSFDAPLGTSSGAWVCRDYGDPSFWCSSVTSFGGQFLLTLDAPSGSDQITVQMNVVLSEVPMYGSIDCGIVPCDFLGRSLMVRAVPLPGAAFCLISALALLSGAYRSASGQPDRADR